jgi:hypothetical protein
MSVTRADQDNFTTYAGKGGIEPFVAALSKRFSASATAQAYDFSDADPAKMYELESRDATLVVVPMPDARCNPDAARHSTYKEGEYRIDLVYRTRSQPERIAAKRKLVETAKEARQPIVAFKEC